MIIAHHLIWVAYGWWLPNDPRGSTSHKIRNDIIAELGELHHGRKKIQPASREIRSFYKKAEDLLQYPLLEFTPKEIAIIGDSFAEVIRNYRYTCYACAIMPDHVHVLIRKHRDKAEEMIVNLQKASRRRLQECALRTADHPVWGGPGWKVFQGHPDEIRRTIRYIQKNPIKIGLHAQQWGFVKEYDGWPLHPGHNSNSPYARRKRGEPF